MAPRSRFKVRIRALAWEWAGKLEVSGDNDGGWWLVAATRRTGLAWLGFGGGTWNNDSEAATGDGSGFAGGRCVSACSKVRLQGVVFLVGEGE